MVHSQDTEDGLKASIREWKRLGAGLNYRGCTLKCRSDPGIALPATGVGAANLVIESCQGF